MFNHLAEFPYIPKAARGFLTAAGPSCLGEGRAVGGGYQLGDTWAGAGGPVAGGGVGQGSTDTVHGSLKATAGPGRVNEATDRMAAHEPGLSCVCA